jgi:hypothetical protein
MIGSILNIFLGSRIARETGRYLDDIAEMPTRASRDGANRLIRALANAGEPMVSLGKTDWNQDLAVPISEIANAHGLITGGTGSGKTRFALGIVKAFIDDSPRRAFGIVDAKGELFTGAAALLAERINVLESFDPEAADALRRRIVIVDFSESGTAGPISPYNLLAKGPHIEHGYLAETRADLLLDLLPGGDALSIGGTALLRRCLMLLSATGLPLTWINYLLYDEALRARLVSACDDAEVRAYFTHQFSKTPAQTTAALSRRMDGLFASESVRLALSGPTAPDLRLLQDDGHIILVNCFGRNLSRSVRRLLQALVLSDLTHAVFARQRPDQSFTWICDEAQNFFVTERLRDHMNDLLTMSRSFGSFLLCVTQNISAAVGDTRLLSTFHTNLRWSLSLRGDPNDAAFLKPALAVTGQMQQPRANPFAEPRVYSLLDERTIEQVGIASLPDRAGYLWLRSRSSEALKITTNHIDLPPDEMPNSILRDPAIGMRISPSDNAAIAADRIAKWKTDAAPAFGSSLTEAYRARRSGAQ